MNISRQNLNRILKELPRAKGYYSMPVQLTRDEGREAFKSFFVLRKKGLPTIEILVSGVRSSFCRSSTCRAASKSKGTGLI